MLRMERMERYYDTVYAIAKSQWVSEFMIGFTARAGSARLAEYAGIHGYQHLVVLADRMTRTDAHRLEQQLQEWVTYDRRSVIFRKYNPDRRGGRYYRSAGQATSDPAEKVHSVYMAWWTAD